jgi:hypothetical protein
MYIGLHVKYRYSRQILMKRVFQQIFGKYSNIFHEIPFIVSRVVSCGRRRDRQTVESNVEANRHFLQFYDCAKKLL